MDRSQTRLLVVLSSLVLLAGGLLYWQGEPEVEADDEATSAVWDVDPERVTRIVVDREAGRLVLERTAAVWSVVQPFAALAEAQRVDDLLRSVTAMKRGVPVDAPPERAAEFGLGEPPEARVELTLDDGSVKALDVGITTAVGFRSYVRAGDGTLAAAAGDPQRLLLAEAERFRDTRIFRFDPSTVRSVRVQSPRGTLAATGSGQRWTLEGFGRADPDRVDDWVMGLLDLRFDHVMELPPVESPIFVVEVGFEDGSRDELRVGEEGPMGVLVSTDDGRAGVVFPEALQQLGRGPTDVGQATAFLIDPEVTAAVRFEGFGKLFAARRDGSAWTAEGLDSDASLDRLGQLAAMPVEYRLEPAPPPEPVEATVTVEVTDLPPVVWEVGPVQPDGTRTVREKGSSTPGVRVSDTVLSSFVGALP